jgi:hypothetical protein
MDYVRQTVSGAKLNDLITLPPTLRNMLVEVIVLPAANQQIDASNKPKRKLGFAQGSEIPDSFFEPLPEEELQAWGI